MDALTERDLDREDILSVYIGAVGGLHSLVASQPLHFDIDSSTLVHLLTVIVRFGEQLAPPRAPCGCDPPAAPPAPPPLARPVLRLAPTEDADA